MAKPLKTPLASTKLEEGIENAQEIVRDALKKFLAMNQRGYEPSWQGEDYDRGYEQGRKDAARVILLSLGVLELGPTSSFPEGEWTE